MVVVDETEVPPFWNESSSSADPLSVVLHSSDFIKFSAVSIIIGPLPLAVPMVVVGAAREAEEG